MVWWGEHKDECAKERDRDNKNVLHILLEQNLSPFFRDIGNTILIAQTIYNANPAAATELDRSGNTPLHLAIFKGLPEHEVTKHLGSLENDYYRAVNLLRSGERSKVL